MCTVFKNLVVRFAKQKLIFSNLIAQKVFLFCEKQKWMVVILTVPHACLFGPASFIFDPGCDADTIAYGRALFDALQANEIDARLLISQTPRRLCDNNRAQCRQRTPLRQKLEQVLREHGPAALLVDVHSFQHPTRDFGAPENVAALLLDVGRGDGASQSLLHYLQRQRVPSALLPGGSPQNDIQQHARQHRARGAVLLELRQGLSKDVLRRVAAALVQWARDATLFSLFRWPMDNLPRPRTWFYLFVFDSDEARCRATAFLAMPCRRGAAQLFSKSQILRAAQRSPSPANWIDAAHLVHFAQTAYLMHVDLLAAAVVAGDAPAALRQLTFLS